MEQSHPFNGWTNVCCNHYMRHQDGKMSTNQWTGAVRLLLIKTKLVLKLKTIALFSKAKQMIFYSRNSAGNPIPGLCCYGFHSNKSFTWTCMADAPHHLNRIYIEYWNTWNSYPWLEVQGSKDCVSCGPLGGRDLLSVLSITATLANHVFLWAHACGRGQISALSSECVIH